MNELSAVQLRIAHILFELPEADGYALAGGAALIIRNVVIRGTRDLDAFIGARPGPEPGTVDALADALAVALRQHGWEVRAARRHPTFFGSSLTVTATQAQHAVANRAPFPSGPRAGVRRLSRCCRPIACERSGADSGVARARFPEFASGGSPGHSSSGRWCVVVVPFGDVSWPYDRSS
jgi:hypothetical protein